MILRSILLVGFLSLPSYALYFHIAETERKCFIEEIPDETMVIGNYKVQLFDPQTKGLSKQFKRSLSMKNAGYGDYPNIGMHVEVRDPDEKVRFL